MSASYFSTKGNGICLRESQFFTLSPGLIIVFSPPLRSRKSFLALKGDFGAHNDEMNNDPKYRKWRPSFLARWNMDLLLPRLNFHVFKTKVNYDSMEKDFRTDLPFAPMIVPSSRCFKGFDCFLLDILLWYHFICTVFNYILESLDSEKKTG